MALYRLLPKAELDIAGIWRWSRGRWSREQADRHVRDLAAAMRTLADEPQRGFPTMEVDPELLRRRHESHMIFYRLADHGIDVVRVLRVRLNRAAHLKGGE